MPVFLEGLEDRRHFPSERKRFDGGCSDSDGVANNRHEAVASAGAYSAIVAGDALAERGMKFLKDVHHLFWFDTLGEGSEIADVAEEAGDEGAVAV